jgi:hypothetical protein
MGGEPTATAADAAEPEHEAHATRNDGPVLEMTREATAQPERSEPMLALPVETTRDDREEDADRSPLH